MFSVYLLVISEVYFLTNICFRERNQQEVDFALQNSILTQNFQECNASIIQRISVTYLSLYIKYACTGFIYLLSFFLCLLLNDISYNLYWNEFRNLSFLANERHYQMTSFKVTMKTSCISLDCTHLQHTDIQWC